MPPPPLPAPKEAWPLHGADTVWIASGRLQTAPLEVTTTECQVSGRDSVANGKEKKMSRFKTITAAWPGRYRIKVQY